MPLGTNGVIEPEAVILESSGIESSLSGYAELNLNDLMVTTSDVLVEMIEAPKVTMSEDIGVNLVEETGVNLVVENASIIDLSPMKPIMGESMENFSGYVGPEVVVPEVVGATAPSLLVHAS